MAIVRCKQCGAQIQVVDGANAAMCNICGGLQAVSLEPAGDSVAPLLERAFLILEDGDFAKADSFFEQVLNQEPKNCRAYLGKLLVELQLRDAGGLRDFSVPYDASKNYEKIMRFGDEGLKAELSGYVAQIKARNKSDRLNGIYTRAKTAMAAARTEGAYLSAAQGFESIPDHLDSAVLAAECRQKAAIARKDAVLAAGKAKMCGEITSNYEAAIGLFASIPGWRDADDQIAACQKKFEELKAKAEADRQAELERKAAEKRARKIKKIAIIVASAACAIIAFIILLTTVIIPNIKYNDAVALIEQGDYLGAYKQFCSIRGYKDSADYLSKLRVICDKKSEVHKDSDGKIEYTTESTYDENGNELSYVKKDSDGKIEESWEYTYDENGNELSEVRKDSDAKIEWSYEYTYDENGNELSEVRKDSDGKILYTHEYTYDENGNRLSYAQKDSDGKIEWSFEYTYDENGNRLSYVQKDPDGKIKYTCEYTYDENGNALSNVRKDSDGKIVESYEYTYDEYGNALSSVWKDSDGKIKLTWEYTYDENGNLLSLVRKDPDGKIEESREYTYENCRFIFSPEGFE